MSRFIKRLQNNYLTPSHPIAFSSPGNIQRFYRKTTGRKLSKKVVDSALAKIDGFTLNREIKKPKYRNPFFVYSLRQQVQMDLVEISELKDHNDDTSFLLVAIDTFSKKAWIETMKDKTAETSLQAIKKVVDEMNPPPISILFDRGKEFTNTLTYTFLRERNIKVIHPFSEIKASIIERFNRTIQDLLYRYMTENQTLRYVDVLQRLLETYNNRGHRTLKYLTPNQAEKAENSEKVTNALNEHYEKFMALNKQPKYSVGQTVRISKEKDKFYRGYNERFKREHFKIVKVKTNMPIPMYILKSLDTNDIIEGAFYDSEVQPIDISDGVFKGTPIDSRMHKGKLQHLMRWRDYGPEHDSWEDATNITKDYRTQ
jgi:transposase InsO family protein